ncbi:MAG TPA: Rieske (2Fe-2S) protein [Actinomycetes bacterium]|nr:Rieske (2Fe-2S) protein [Actinomycetes bacterium]
MSMPMQVVKQLEGLEGLDPLIKQLQHVVSRLVKPRIVRNTLSGTTLGHALHPMLTDLPIGAWTAAGLLDLVGGKRSTHAADLLVGAGIAAAVPTAAAGANDWSDTYGDEARVGLVHAALNSTALLLYGASLAARASRHRTLGRLLGWSGLAAVVASGYLGGHLTFAQGVNVNHTAFEERPTDWTPATSSAELGEGATIAATAGSATVFLHRHDGRIYALANTCSHLGGPLNEGTVHDGCITCPWHGSTFRLDTGKVVRGPARTAQPTYDVREAAGQMEVRAAQP